MIKPGAIDLERRARAKSSEISARVCSRARITRSRRAPATQATFWINYITVTFLLISSSGTNHDLLCFVDGQGQTSVQKHRTKSFAKLHNHLPLSWVPAYINYVVTLRDSGIRYSQLPKLGIFASSLIETIGTCSVCKKYIFNLLS